MLMIKKMFTFTSLFAALGLTLAMTAHAQAPALLPIQGYLSGADGTVLADGSYTVRFRIYESADPLVTAVLHDEVLDVNVSAGYFTVYLGEQQSLGLSSFRNKPNLYLGVKVGTDTEASPRLQLATTLFAAVANYCGDADTLGGNSASAFASATHVHAYSALTGTPSTFAPSAHLHSWSDLMSVPAGFADGVDNDTTYSAGTGLSLASTQFSVNPATVQTRVAGTCTGANQSLKTIAQDGSTTCETDDVGPTYSQGAGLKILANKIGLGCQWEVASCGALAAGATCSVTCGSATAFSLTGGCDGTSGTTLAGSYPGPNGSYKSTPIGPWPVDTLPADSNVPVINTWVCQPTSSNTAKLVNAYVLCCEL